MLRPAVWDVSVTTENMCCKIKRQIRSKLVISDLNDICTYLQNVRIIRLIEGLCSFWMVGHVLEQLIQNVQPRVGDVPHRVFEGPDDRV